MVSWPKSNLLTCTTRSSRAEGPIGNGRRIDYKKVTIPNGFQIFRNHFPHIWCGQKRHHWLPWVYAGTSRDLLRECWGFDGNVEIFKINFFLLSGKAHMGLQDVRHWWQWLYWLQRVKKVCHIKNFKFFKYFKYLGWKLCLTKVILIENKLWHLLG